MNTNKATQIKTQADSIFERYIIGNKQNYIAFQQVPAGWKDEYDDETGVNTLTAPDGSIIIQGDDIKTQWFSGPVAFVAGAAVLV